MLFQKYKIFRNFKKKIIREDTRNINIKRSHLPFHKLLNSEIRNFTTWVELQYINKYDWHLHGTWEDISFRVNTEFEQPQSFNSNKSVNGLLNDGNFSCLKNRKTKQCKIKYGLKIASVLTGKDFADRHIIRLLSIAFK